MSDGDETERREEDDKRRERRGDTDSRLGPCQLARDCAKTTEQISRKLCGKIAHGSDPDEGKEPGAGGAVAPSPSSPRRRRLSVRHREVLIRWHLTAPARKAGRWRGLGTRSAAATLDACRALLADHLSYGDRWGNPLFARGGHPAVPSS
ncbi:unnamed protein product [Pleuronectes platessa]|uniref:Uncharacterized protein n=1 Tax=Pleuronectes platessa TaxID=8262 RepID=A0A9N7UQ14_PLEPL|nr:unnamed protein product [Pleuronectes platessa]